MIYFQICIFEPLETTKAMSRVLSLTLWFTFKFVSLNHWKQLTYLEYRVNSCCDLLSNLYLWTIGNNSLFIRAIAILLWFTFKFVSLNHWKQLSKVFRHNQEVVIYFQICIFEPLETTPLLDEVPALALWFTFKFVSLNHWKQPICHNYRYW